MSRLQRIIVGDAFHFRSPSFWRDLSLGFFWGIALMWATSDVLRSANLSQNWWKEIVFVVVPFGIGMLSPRRLLVLFFGLCLPMFRVIHLLLWAFRSLSSALVVLVWAVVTVFVARQLIVSRDDSPDFSVPKGFTGIELLILMAAFALSLFTNWKIHTMLGLG